MLFKYSIYILFILVNYHDSSSRHQSFSSAEEDRLDGTGNLDYTDGDLTATSSLHDQSGHGDSRTSGRRKGEPGDDNLPSNEEMPDHYIYVTYPPELKQRLLDR